MSRQMISLVTLVLVCTGSSIVFGQPVFNIEPSRIDFESLEPHEMASRELMITNSGSAELKILQVEARCGCTVPDLEKTVLQPGESAPLVINFTAKKEFQGDVMKIVHIHTNDPQTPNFELYVNAFVHVPIEINPISKRVGFQTSDYTHEASETVTFKAYDVPDLEMEIERYKPDLFQLEIIDNYEGDAQGVALIVTKPSGMPAGEHRDIFRLKTNVKDMPTIDIECRAKVERELKVNRDNINFRYVKEGQTLRNRIRVAPSNSHGGLVYKVTGAEIDIPGLEARIEETIVNRETWVHIEGKALRTTDAAAIEAKGRLSGTLRIFTDIPALPEMQIKISYMLKM